MTHDAVMTMAEMEIVKALYTGEYAETMLVKNLFYQDKKNKARMWIVCAAEDTRIDLRR